MNKKSDYYTDREKQNFSRIRSMLDDLPAFFREFINSIEDQTLSLTRLNYCYDLRIFFHFLIDQRHEDFPYSAAGQLTVADMQKISAFEIEEYLRFIQFYTSGEDKELENHEYGKSRKLSSLRSFFKYLYRQEYIQSNPASLVDYPAVYEKAIIRLEPDEIARLLDAAESGQGLTEKQLNYHKYTKMRDVAILSLLLGTGIRVSECAGLNTDDFNFSENSFIITRKGGDQAILYFGDETAKALAEYRNIRQNIVTEDKAFFLSLQNKRLSQRSIQLLVKKYSSVVTPLKHITPHKLRSSFGTNLYRESGDIYLVADVLGHRDINTTRKHYAAMSEDRRKMAAKIIKLRNDGENGEDEE